MKREYFTIHENDFGMEMYTEKYTRWLEDEVKRLTAERDTLREMGDVCGDLVGIARKIRAALGENA